MIFRPPSPVGWVFSDHTRGPAGRATQEHIPPTRNNMTSQITLCYYIFLRCTIYYYYNKETVYLSGYISLHFKACICSPTIIYVDCEDDIDNSQSVTFISLYHLNANRRLVTWLKVSCWTQNGVVSSINITPTRVGFFLFCFFPAV